MPGKRTGIIIAAAAVTTGLLTVIVASQTGSESAQEELDRIGIPDMRVVAEVNGYPIKADELQLTRVTSIAGGFNEVGRPLAGSDDRELLEGLIDQNLVSQAAEAAGYSVSEDDISMAVNAGIVAPLNDDEVPSDIKELLTAMLQARGVEPADVLADPGIREALRKFVLVNRYLGETGRTYEEVVSDARATADIVIHEEVLATME